MSDLEALKDGPSSPVGPTLAPDIRHAEALQKLMERSMGSEKNTSQRDGDAILRLRATARTIEEIRTQFQSPSFSVGVLHQGQTIYTRGYGHADKASRRRPDPQTVYRAGCCTHAFTATILCLLEQARRVSFDGTFGSLSESFPEILEHNPKFGKNPMDQIYLGDVLSHCTGLAAAPFAIRGVNGSMFAQHKDILHIFANLPSVSDLRSEWKYTEWSYVVVAYLIDQISHLPWAEALDDILGRLGLMRTYTNRIADDNYARAYIMSSESTANQSYQLPLIEIEDSFEWSGSVRTCVADMLRWCKLLIKASQPDHFDGGDSLSRPIHPVSIYDPETLTKERVLKGLWAIQQPDTLLEHSPEQQYATGLYAFILPTSRINTVTNDLDVTRSYVMGADSAPRKVIGHAGDLGSFTSAYWVFPQTESAVVVLTNANSANGDPSNIVAQVLIQALFELQPAIDYTEVATQIVLNAKLQWESTFNEWKSHRIPGTKPNHANAYIGDYKNANLRMTLCVKHNPPSQPHHPEEGQMMFRINAIREQTFELYHYHRDSWTFMPSSRDECLRLGLGIYIPCWQSFILEFGPYDSGQSRWVRWRLDPDPRVTPHVFGRVVEKARAPP